MDSFGGAIWWVFGRFVGPHDEPLSAVLVAAPANPDADNPEPIREAAPSQSRLGQVTRSLIPARTAPYSEMPRDPI
jgi:hypothetical protein